jgi:DNA-nicking Smr family endonuclease
VTREGRDGPPAGAPFELLGTPSRPAGIARGVDRAHLRRLRRGEIPIDRRVDLHGLRASEAPGVLAAEIRSAQASGQRCALVVHGRGLHSDAGPVLRDGLVEWLSQPALRDKVLAFAGALPRDGGEGATYLLLRRRRAEPGRG